MRTSVLIANVLILFVNSVAIITVCGRIISDPCNHVGFDPRWLWPVYITAILAGAVQVFLRRKFWGLPACLFIVGTVGLAGGIVIDQFNILVQYDVWGARGMPPRPF